MSLPQGARKSAPASAAEGESQAPASHSPRRWGKTRSPVGKEVPRAGEVLRLEVLNEPLSSSLPRPNTWCLSWRSLQDSHQSWK